MKTLREAYRPKLQQPFGSLLPPAALSSALANASFIICVGDATTFALIEQGIIPDVAIVDGQAQRKPIAETMRSRISSSYALTLHARNPAGHLSKEAEETVALALKNARETHSCVLIEIEGEEDLLFLPALLHAPEGAFVLYGQPHQGMVMVKATLSSKNAIAELIAHAFE